ncbi:hypothetical protein L1987_01081 [Smallanthus sonchifolius]|uniref:Uncharacterized protein n=1 Tax=Smallanthus sonchifolius TaxID=185202 RepID=A0ACB9K496_9ASTR|nr:hypothetical protein L1987_01081 [Smallanthus sonchifolius]
MSLVDYASSDEEDEAVGREEGRNKVNLVIPHQKPPPEKTHLTNYIPSRLPDASILLNSPSLPSNTSGIYDHTSAVAAAMAQNASRKRDLKESGASYPHGKIPRGNLPHSKNVQKTTSGLLCPPQLSGRSNVVTEDISKLFSRRTGSEPSSK